MRSYRNISAHRCRRVAARIQRLAGSPTVSIGFRSGLDGGRYHTSARWYQGLTRKFRQLRVIDCADAEAADLAWRSLAELMLALSDVSGPHAG